MGSERVAIFIDGSNLYHALEGTLKRHDLDFTQFVAKLCGDRTLFRTYYYNALQDVAVRPDAFREQQEFLDGLRKTPYLEVRLGTIKTAQGTQVEKGVDIMLGIDLLNCAWNNLYDTAVLVSGDADFAYAVQTVKNMGKHVEVAYFEGATARELLGVADVRHQLDNTFFSTLWTSRRRRRRRGGAGKAGQDGLSDERQQQAT
ncbi:MAG: NYN domain-containing protein [Dehalococcoidia bacterium]|nr:MAG: NYN domain-containing protein [Dehalococcoidia bacterium]